MRRTGTALLDTSWAREPNYNEMTDPGCWSTFDTARLGVQGFQGAAFDGRHVYLVPSCNGSYHHGTVARYDTHGAFAPRSWTTFDATALWTRAKGFEGAVFDGRYVYFVPHFNGAWDGLVTRYDTRLGFHAAASWSAFDVTRLAPGAKGYHGAAFDGRYVYFVPLYSGMLHGLVLRLDTTAPFTSPAAWSGFDLTTVSRSARGFAGAVFDGRHVYFLPRAGGSALARLDSHAPFDAKAAWSTFDVREVATGATGFLGAAFDGRHLYLVPHGGDGVAGLVARYDTGASLTSPSAWSTFDPGRISPRAKGFAHAGFDGRYVYLAPGFGGEGVIVRHDARRDLTDPGAWSAFDLAQVHPEARGFAGAAFDGRHLYLVPGATSLVVRFDAKNPPGMPPLPHFHGSFF